MPGFVAYFGAKDVPGSNIVGEVIPDEELFATEKVTCVGQIIGMTVAETEIQALRAADRVVVKYGVSSNGLECELEDGRWKIMDAMFECQH